MHTSLYVYVKKKIYIYICLDTHPGASVLQGLKGEGKGGGREAQPPPTPRQQQGDALALPQLLVYIYIYVLESRDGAARRPRFLAAQEVFIFSFD